MHSNHRRGAVSEYTAAAAFSQQGWEIFWPPSGSGAADFVAVRDDESCRVQVKTARWMEKARSRFLRATIKTPTRTYKSGDFDYLAVVAPDGRVWVIPFDELPDTTLIYLERHRNGEVHHYERDKWIVTQTSNS